MMNVDRVEINYERLLVLRACHFTILIPYQSLKQLRTLHA